MRVDVGDELAVIRSWRDAQRPSSARDAMVDGFLWALALVAERDVPELRAQLDAPRNPFAARPAVPPPSPGAPPAPAVPPAEPWLDPASAPAWPGLGIARIERTREAGDGPLSRARAFTAGPDGRPVALASSYAEMAAGEPDMARGLSDDAGGSESGADVLADTTT